ncbi:MAG: serine hydrolase [Clostridiales bacterium]|nr:serine hydrolase [Clostridiales bacterium]
MKRFTNILIIAIAASLILSSCKIKEVIDDIIPEITPSTTTDPFASETPSPQDVFWNIPTYETNDIRDLQDYLEIILSQNPGSYGLHFTNLTTGIEINIRDDEKYISADSIALPVNLCLYSIVTEGSIEMSEQVELKQTDKIGGTGDISRAAAGTKFTLEEISAASLKQNDMTAVAMLIRYITPSKLDEYLASLGTKNTIVPEYSSPLDMATFMSEIYRLENENPGVFSALTVNLNAEQPILASSLIGIADIASKTGMFGGIPSYNDSAIVYGENPYVLSFFTENVLKSEAIKVMEAASKAIYSFINFEQLPIIEYPVNVLVPGRIVASARPKSVNYFEEVITDDGIIMNYRDMDIIEFPDSGEYEGDLGLITFRGNNYRDGGAFGTADIKEEKLEIIWEFDIGSISTQSGGYWPGVGWTGQPSIVAWSEETQANMNIKESLKGPNLREVIYASLDGNIYFADLATGEWTRDPIHIGYPTKGSVSIDPRGYPLLYTGQGIGENGYETLAPAYRIFSLIDQTLLYEIGGDDPDSLRVWPNFDSSGLLDAKNDTFYEAGENGIIYKIDLKTSYDEAAGEISINPDLVKYRYLNPFGERIGIESSPVIYKNLMYCTDNNGMIMCINLNTFKAEWVAPTYDDTDATLVLDVTDEGVFLYTGNEVDISGEFGENEDKIYDSTISKFNALTGELVWEAKYPCMYNSVINGGVLGTPVMGKNDISGLVIFGLAKSGGEYMGRLVALDKETGEEVWAIDSEAYSWSSPTAVYTPEGKSYILYCNFAGNMYLIEGTTGHILDVVSLGANIEGTPGVFNDIAVIGSYARKIFGVRIK